MDKNNVVSLLVVRQLRKAKECDLAYQSRIAQMSKLDLLEEMMRFQEERSQQGHLTIKMIVKGLSLFKLLEEKAETEELRALALSYRRHLRFELNIHLQIIQRSEKHPAF